MPLLRLGYENTMASVLGICSQLPCCEAVCGEARVSELGSRYSEALSIAMW